jgi:tetratricopeptide (TPR) repeat protein
VPRDEHIVIFHCNGSELSDIDARSIPISEFTGAGEYIQLINKLTQSQIFLIISGSIVPLQIQSTFDLQQIHGIYFFRNYQFKYPINERKVSGSFDKQEDLYEQLHNDILFYRELDFHTIRIDICPKLERNKIHPKELTEKQIVFLKFQLFSDILPQAPLLKFERKDLVKICDNLYSCKAEETADYINQFHREGDEINYFDQDPKFAQIALRFHQLYHSNELNDWFILQKPFIDIQKRVFQSTEVSTMDTVYLSKIISNDTLEVLKSSSDKFISIGLFILATRSLLKARDVARQAANNGLITVLFEIEVIRGTNLLNIDDNHVIFRVGPVFCSKSINQGPDGVWYVKMKCVDKEFHLIKEQLQFDINVRLSWLTYGNYLHFLNRFEEGEAYFKYLLGKLSSENIHRFAVYNNMGLLYARKYEEEKDRTNTEKDQYLDKAKSAYEEVRKNVKLIESSSAIEKSKDEPCIKTSTIDVTPTSTTADYSTVVGNIADLYYKTEKYEEALKSYVEALELSTDQQSCRYYQKMILDIKERLK